MMIGHYPWIFFVSAVTVFKCHESYPASGVVKNTIRPSTCVLNRTGIFLYGKHLMSYSNVLQKRLHNVKVKTPTGNSRHGISKLKRSVHFKRTKIPARNTTENFWESLNEFLKNFETIKDNERIDSQKSDNYVDVNQFLAVKDNYFTIPKSTIELLQLNNMCPRNEAEVHPCKTIFTMTRMVDTVWPRNLITASCRCNGQRCSVKGVDTCTALVSRITVIGRKGNRVRDLVPVACVCMAFKGNSAREMIPLIV